MQDELTPKQVKEQERLIDAKISLLQLAKEVGNIHKASGDVTEFGERNRVISLTVEFWMLRLFREKPVG